MRYRDNTLAPDDIEWIGHVPRERLKEALFNDELYEEILSDVGAEEALVLFTRLHRNIANQLIVRGVSDACASEWTRRAVALCIDAKSRRNQVRRLIRSQVDPAIAERFIASLAERFPRAVWGSALSNTAATDD